MQEALRRSQQERSDTMRAALVRIGRGLFVRNGYAATGTPEIVATAGVTRGALYHHFADKEALFAAVIRAEAEAIATAIANAEFGGLSSVETLVLGGEAYLSAMRVHGRVRLMLIEAPAVLPPEVLAKIRSTTAVAGAGPMAALLSAAYDRAAIAIDAGDAPGPWLAALERLVRGATP